MSHRVLLAISEPVESFLAIADDALDPRKELRIRAAVEERQLVPGFERSVHDGATENLGPPMRRSFTRGR